MILIDKTGAITVPDERVRRFLQDRAGTWRPASSVGNVLVLHRVGAPAARGKGPRVTMTGDIEKEGWVIEIINFISSSRLTGDFTVVAGGETRELFFDKGALRMACSTAKSDLLGEFLLAEGMINREQLEAALKGQTAGRKLGEVLVEEGILSGPDIYQILHRKIEKIFIDTIMLREGVYYFIEDVDLTRMPASVYMDTQALLMEGVKRIDDLRYYSDTVPRRSTTLDASPGLLDGMSQGELKLIALVDGKRSLSEIDGILRLGTNETIKLGQQLVGKGILEVGSTREMELQNLRNVLETFNQALKAVYEATHSEQARAELTRLGTEFIQKGSHNNKTLQKVGLDEDGTVLWESIKGIFESSNTKDRLQLISLILTQYVSFVLFNANSQLGAEDQQRLYGMVNEKLSSVAYF